MVQQCQRVDSLPFKLSTKARKGLTPALREAHSSPLTPHPHRQPKGCRGEVFLGTVLSVSTRLGRNNLHLAPLLNLLPDACSSAGVSSSMHHWRSRLSPLASRAFAKLAGIRTHPDRSLRLGRSTLVVGVATHTEDELTLSIRADQRGFSGSL